MATTFTSSTARTRRAAPSHKPWTPWRYQKRAKTFLLETASAALFLDPGLGKTSIVLAAFSELLEEGVADKMLVIAPLRVCQLVWRQEAAGWSDFRHLRFSFLHGPKKAEALKQDADVYLINPEGVAWLAEQFKRPSQRFPFDTVCIDELTKFKNYGSKRVKKLRPLLKRVPRRWGLTGTPAPNGYLDLFGQMLMLDDGRALGPYFTHYRDHYFMPDGYTGFDYKLQPGADRAIERRIAPMVLRMAAEDYIDMPKVIDNLIEIDLEPAARKAYDQMKKDALLALPGGVVTAANAGAVYSKLSQLANGAVYYNDDGGKRRWEKVHDAKLQAIDELAEELAGQPLLVGYEFEHDLDRLREFFGDRLETLSGANEKQAQDIQDRWNAGEIEILACHPASVGHGLNLQKGGACHVCWFSATWDLELYDQLIRRLRRQGNDAKTVVNHLLLVRNSIDYLKRDALGDKDTTQASFLRRMNAEILQDGGSPTAGQSADDTAKEAIQMVRKLGGGRRRDEDDEVEAEEEEAPRKSWGRGGRASDEDEDEEDRSQRDRIRDKIKAKKAAARDEDEDEDEDEDDRAPRKSFSKSVQKQLDDEDEDEDEADEEPEDKKPAPKKTVRKKSTVSKSAPKDEASDAAPSATVGGPSPAFERRLAREVALRSAIEAATTVNARSAEEIVAVAEVFVAFTTD